MMFASTHPALNRSSYNQSGRVLERFLRDAVLAPQRSAPLYKQDEAAFHFVMDMPGIARDQLSISVDGATVHIASREGAPRNYRMAYELPEEIDPTLSEAKLEHGVLTLKLGRKVAVNNATEITIQ